MQLLTLFRGMAWFGAVVVFWSLNIRWGTDPNLPSGPPSAWHRAVVGAGLLGFIAALALSVSGRKGNPPSYVARGVALAGGALALIIGWRLYSNAEGMYADWIAGTGWTWLMAGAGMLTGAAIGAMGLKAAPGDSKSSRRNGKKRKGR